MADSAFTNDTPESATDLGVLAFEGSSFDGPTTSRISDFGSVGLTYFLSTIIVSEDPDDFFSFDDYELEDVKVNFNADSVGDFAGVLMFIPYSGVSHSEGAVVGTWYGGEHTNRDNRYVGLIDEIAANAADFAGSGFGTSTTYSGELWSQGNFSGAQAVWTFNGDPVEIRVRGLIADGTVDELDGRQPFSDAFDEIDYRFTILPGSGEIDAPTPDPEPTPQPGPPTPGMVFVNSPPESQTVVGGQGIDFFEVRGFLDEDLILAFPSQGVVTITERFRPERVDTLIEIERLDFVNGFLAFDTNGNAGQSYRLYQAAFDRTPDAEGLGFWIEHFDDGNVDLVAMANHFMQSEEFAQKYGNPDTLGDFDFLTLLYANVLDRPADQAGFDFWSDQQDAGLSRSEMLQYFSESVENYANVADAIAGGIFYV